MSRLRSPDPDAYARDVARATEQTVRAVDAATRLVDVSVDGSFPHTKLRAHFRHPRGDETLEYPVWDSDDNPPDEQWMDAEELGITYGRYLLEGCW